MSASHSAIIIPAISATATIATEIHVCLTNIFLVTSAG